MATYIILSRLTPGALTDPEEFKRLAEDVSEKIKRECPVVEPCNMETLLAVP